MRRLKLLSLSILTLLPIVRCAAAELPTNLSLTIQQPDGKPAAQATVAVVLAGHQMTLTGDDVICEERHKGQTDAGGQLMIGEPAGDFRVAIVHPTGYLAVDGDAARAGKPIRLQPWARVEGQLIIGGKPGGNQRVLATYLPAPIETWNRDGTPHLEFRIDQKTDANGRFVFDRLPPGKTRISRATETLSFGTPWLAESNSQAVETVAGQTGKVQLGGTGRPVIGKINIPAELAARKDWSFRDCFACTANPMPPITKLPAAYATAKPDEKTKMYLDYLKTDEGQARQAAQEKALMTNQIFSFVVNADGTFRIEDVPTGTYQLWVDTVSNSGEQRVAAGGLNFTVPEMPGGRSDDPLQLPTVELKLAEK